jgi:hypothetical protein
VTVPKVVGYREHPRGFWRRVVCLIRHRAYWHYETRQQRPIPIRNQIGTELGRRWRVLKYYHCWRCGMRWKRT